MFVNPMWNKKINWVYVPPDSIGNRAVHASGDNGSALNSLEYITISTTGNATDFGDLTQTRSGLARGASFTRGYFSGGATSSTGTTSVNTIDYITIATTGNATDFGDLTLARFRPTGYSSNTRGITAGGLTGTEGTTEVNTIDYITIATTGNATDFGDLTSQRYLGGGLSSPTRGINAGGGQITVGAVNTIDYITIATTGNATDFGDLTSIVRLNAGLSSQTRGVIAGINNWIAMNYITIATTGNASSFGNLSNTRITYNGGSSNQVRGVWVGGYNFSTIYTNIIDYITIATTGNATDFGDLITTSSNGATTGNGHGGLSV
jgi:hypothetical protein